MRTDRSRKMLSFVALLVAILAFQGLHSAEAAIFCATNSSQLHAALSTAEDNGEADAIHIAQGVYTGNFSYQSEEQLVIRGGYAADCSTLVADPSSTVLSGGSTGTVLEITIEGEAKSECDGITLRNGSAERGGGLRINSWGGNVTVSNSIFHGNHAAEFGAGLYLSSSGTITLSHNTLYDNESDSYGGGASIHGGTLVMTANVIRDNTADGAAGGIHTSGTSVSLVNNLFYSNSAVWYHGAVLVEGDAIRVINNTITSNSSEGLGAGLTVMLTEDSDHATIHNNIIYANSGYQEGNDLCIFNDQDENGIPSPVSLLNNDFDQSAAGTDIVIPFSIDASNLNNRDPLFVSSGTSDFRLTKGSPCIDTGTSTDAPSTDIAGTARPQGSGYDMGAYEYVGSPSPDIKANGQDGPLVVTSNDPVSITVSLSAGDKLGSNADWWLAFYTSAASSAGWNSYVYPTGWQPGIHLCIQIPLFDLSPLQVRNTTLSKGDYTFYFAVDAPNGSPSGPWFGLDYVNVQVR